MTCEHKDLHLHINHHRSGDTNVAYLEIQAKCKNCDTPLIFRGPDVGSSPQKPMINPDGTEIRLPIIGLGERVKGDPRGYQISDGMLPRIQKAIEETPYIWVDFWDDEKNDVRTPSLREFYEGTYQSEHADELFPAVAKAVLAELKDNVQ